MRSKSPRTAFPELGYIVNRVAATGKCRKSLAVGSAGTRSDSTAAGPEDDLRAGLRPYRVDPDTFEAAIRQQLRAGETRPADEPLVRRSPLLRSAAAFLPLEVLAGCKGTAATANLAPAGGGAYKLLSY